LAHRLFHTIVLSSSLLCEGAASGCTQTHEAFGDGGDRDASGLSPDASTPDGGAYPLCEPGWPTTKAQMCEVGVDGTAVCCRPVFSEDAGWIPEDCCIARREDGL
jgi:hypothetical protein